MVVIDMGGAATDIANEKDAIMQATGMGIGKISIGTFHPGRDIIGHEQIEDTIDAVRRDPPPLRGADRFGHVISAGRAFKPRQRGEH